MKLLLPPILLVFLCGLGISDDPKSLPATPAARAIEFNRDIRPILSDACFACHGFDPKSRKAKLRLDAPEGAFAERNGVTPIKPFELQGSELWRRVSSTDADVVMPPPDSKKKLTARQRETLRLWIEQGAKYQKHWSFEPITRPRVPEIQNPHAAIRNPVDAFLLARLDLEGLKPNGEADRETQIRRVAFALTGLPPTVKEVDDFLGDRTADAYEKMVDRYLSSPRYGEEMARHWLDITRYADTHGLHLDNERYMWKYRDWVVKAFNDNLPFDRFTVEQVAGDLLPNPTQDQLVATGFNRCNVTTGEGGSIEAEWIYRNAVDRTSTMAQAFLALTAGCAVCHDHKFDPISSKEYYSLYSFFLSAADPALDNNVSIVGPYAKLPTASQQKALDVAAKAEAAAKTRLMEVAAKAKYSDPAVDKEKSSPKTVHDVLFDDTFPLAASNSNTTRNAADWVTDPPFSAKSGRRVLRQANSFFHQDAIRFHLRPVVVPTQGVFEAWVWLDPMQPPGAIAVQLGGGRNAWWGKESGEGNKFMGGEKGDRKGPLPKPGEWARLTISCADIGLKDGQQLASLNLQEFGGVVYWDVVALTGQSERATSPLDSFRIWWKGLNGKAPPELPSELNAVVAGGPDKQQSTEGAAKLQAFYLAFIARPISDELAKAQTDWEKARSDHAAAEDAIPGSLIFRDLGMPRQAFVMLRGQYDKPGDKVQPGVPAILPPLKLANPVARPTRLDLANWLVATENPLTARVAVNRLWQQFFGTGLVRTSADFGSQGEAPSHPELLDWLADEYRQTGWDTKKLVKLLLLTETFRRSAKFAPEIRAKDPENRLLGRGPRMRLDAEQLRDNALFVSGLMNHEIGGRGVRPYQPANIWEPIGYGDSNTRYYLQDHGAALYRRSLYTFIKRTAPHPFLTNFDAPNREQICAVRDRTNTPLQALQLMNDVQHFEAARALAERTIAEGGSTTKDRVGFLYRTVLSRKADDAELKLVSASFEKQRAIFKADPAAAKKVVNVGESKPMGAAPDDEVAAWTMIANLVMNLDETINRN
jgi:hypothetical protein